MADKDDTTSTRSGRSQTDAHVSAETRRPKSLQQAIEAERAQLLQAHAVIHCLYEVLLHAEGDDAICYAEAAYVAANLIDESVERLDFVRLRPLMEDLGGPYTGKNEVREARGIYLVNTKVASGGRVRGYFYEVASGMWSSDDGSPAVADSQLRALAATAGQEVTYTAVPPGSGRRIENTR